MSNDNLPELLRLEANKDWRGHPPGHAKLCAEAADELERQRRHIEELEKLCPDRPLTDSEHYELYGYS